MNRSAWWLIRDRNNRKRNSNHAADFGFRRRSLAGAAGAHCLAGIPRGQRPDLPWGEPHQLTSPGPGDLEVVLIVANPPVDCWQYPDSNQWGQRHPRTFFRPTEVHYWDSED